MGLGLTKPYLKYIGGIFGFIGIAFPLLYRTWICCVKHYNNKIVAESR